MTNIDNGDDDDRDIKIGDKVIEENLRSVRGYL